MKLVDLTGQRFGKLVVLYRVEDDKNRNRMWLCQCDCGRQKVIGGRHLTSGVTRSCGCGNDYHTKHLTHGQRHTRLYGIWSDMKYRCDNPRATGFENYGGRGINYCDEWRTFEPFHEWAIAHGYRDDLTIDRINNDGNYSPDNCRWSTPKEQANNRRTTNMKRERNEYGRFVRRKD